MLRITIYNEYVHERENEAVARVYPGGIHETLRRQLACGDVSVRTVTLAQLPDGLSENVLEETDVLVWWAHKAHHLVPDEVAVRVQQAVLRGMGAVFLHSGHHSKPFRLLMGTSCNLTWREEGDRELVWVCNPAHPIAQGLGRFIRIDHDETYGEPFDIPEPDQLVFISGYEHGEVFRSGCCFLRGNGRIFYFQPGHETYPVYENPDVVRVLNNAVRWAAPVYRVRELVCPNVGKPLSGL